jgi:hypothetical protein
MPSIDQRLRKLEAAQSAPGWGPIFVMTVGIEPAGFEVLWGDVTVMRKPGETVETLQERCRALHPGQRLWASV